MAVPAVFWVEHDSEGNICPDIRRMPQGEDELWIYSNSIQALIDDRGRYFNRPFVNDGGAPRELFAWGVFKCFRKQLTPESYDGHVKTAGRGQIWQQTAVKIPNRMVADYRRRFGNGWIRESLAGYVAGDPQLDLLGTQRCRREEAPSAAIEPSGSHREHPGGDRIT